MSPEGPPAAHDLIVVLPGIMGSTLARDGEELWAPAAGVAARALASRGGSLQALALPPGVGDGDPGDGVVARRLMPDVHVVPGLWSVNCGYDVLLSRLRRVLGATPAARGHERQHPPNLLPFPYDWRLSCRHNGERLQRAVERELARLRDRGGRFADARATYVCHSMGGLVARWHVERLGGAATTRLLITLGTPHRGAAKALGELVNGVRKGFAADLTAFARSLPSAYQLLPQYACVRSGGRLLTPAEAALPRLDAALVADGAAFHAELDAAAAQLGGRSPLRPLVGVSQPTPTTAAPLAGGAVRVEERIDGVDEGGDATVPRLSATPRWLPPDAASVRWAAARHGALQSDPAVLDALEGLLTASPVVRRAAAGAPLGLRMADVALAGEAVALEAWAEQAPHAALAAHVADARGRQVAAVRLAPADGAQRTTLGPLPPGAYTVAVGGHGAAAGAVAPIAQPLVVCEAAT